jgi:hypothetical protein
MKAGRYILILVLIAAAWVSGYGYGRWYGPKPAAGGAHQADHKPGGYHCPMHPGFRSDKPGDCGICGMRLVPDDDAAHPAGAAPRAEGAPPANMPMGTINVSPEKQQLIGVRYGTV